MLYYIICILANCGAKVQISENNTKQKAYFLYILSNVSTFETVSKVRISENNTIVERKLPRDS